MINSVEEYLEQLRRELAGCSASTMQSALADSEEHLRTALASNPDFQSVIEDYGAPEEIAANYREMDDGIPLPDEQATAVLAHQGGSRSRAFPIIWTVVGSIAVLISLGLILAGGGIIWADSALTDDDGYFMSDSLHMTRSSYAIISEPAEIELGVSRAFDLGILGELRGQVESNDPGKNIFVGVAREEDLARYLGGVPHDRIEGLQIENARWEYETFTGDTQPAPPATQTFWAQSASGPAAQDMTWEPETGTWVFVIMNEDGSAGVDVDAKIGTAIPWLLGAGIGLLAGGALLLVAGTIVIVLAVRRLRIE